ncbi:phosphoglycolate phosphatase [Magnetospirillum sulfuroxidans]|uniref:Phosphoglycolate phosphatase n=1 Tax=Magnetospirillum sulfuroxidans TaxID=611300 RepID=A0ABS5IHB3_9PROT|nr:phosphoglycolate phosphatase [Magnetospirillum sulfuroxidans]MBR9973811.1 phosphoglycolate phosphatase [Magnetospirillum sulfuroxidans]
MNRVKRAAIFDLDGTLIDSLPDLTTAINKTLADHGLPPLTTAQIAPMVGDGASTLVTRAFAAHGLAAPPVEPVLQQFLTHYEPHAADQTKPWPGVIETLEYLRAKGLILAVCTNKPTKATHEILAALGLDHFFAVVVGGDDTPALKPNPAHINAVLDRLGVHHEEAVMIGDSINDVLAAKGANVPVVVLSFGYSRVPPHELGADLVVDDFAMLKRVIAG